jgi:hypothetical protein
MNTKNKIRFNEILENLSDCHGFTGSEWDKAHEFLKEVYNMGLKEFQGSKQLTVDFLTSKEQLNHETAHLSEQDRIRVKSALNMAKNALGLAIGAAGLQNLPFINTATTLTGQLTELNDAF